MKKIISMLIIITTLITLIPMKVKATEQTTPSGIEHSKIGEKIEEYIEDRKETTASVSVAVFSGQETIYETNYGFANIEENRKVDKDTVYDWGSVSKMLIWTSVMQLKEAEKIDLNRDIREYLPKGFLNKISFDKPITMMNLMNHTAGFEELVNNLETSNPNNIVSLKDTLKKMQPNQIYEPGTVCSYSNWGASLAALIVEEVSGEKFYNYVRNHIFIKLNIEHTAVKADWTDNPWAKEQREKVNGYAIFEGVKEYYGAPKKYIMLYPAGSTVGTLEDFTRFAKAFVPKEGEKSPLFQKEETLREMLSATSYFGDSKIPRSCHGLLTNQYAVSVVGHTGNTIYGTSSLYFDPISKLGMVVMTNEVGETTYNCGLYGMLFGDYKSDTVYTGKDMSGIYTSSRAMIGSGYAKMNAYIGALLPFSKTDKKGEYAVPIGQGKLKQVGEHEYIMDNENGWKYLMYETEKADGSVCFEMMSQDIVRQDSLKFWSKIALLVIAVLSFVYSFSTLIIDIICVGIKKITGKKIRVTGISKFNLLTRLAVIILGISVYSLYFSSGEFVVSFVAFRCIVILLMAMIPVVNLIYYCTHHKKVDMTKVQRIYNITTLLFGLLVTINTIYWQWFHFVLYL